MREGRGGMIATVARRGLVGFVGLMAVASAASAQDMGALPRREPVVVALERVEALAAPEASEGRADAMALARLALELAGPAAIDPLTSRLDAASALPPDQGSAVMQAQAWALGEVLPRAASDAAGTKQRARAIASLREALWVQDWPARISAASALGVVEASEAELDLVALRVVAEAEEMRARAGGEAISRGRAAAILLALAGAGGDVARVIVNDELRVGGDVRWARTMVALHARLGPSCWPDVVATLEEAPGVDVRATAAAILLVLAEPASACRMAEAYGREPEPAIRLTLIQALAATATPIARAALGSIAGGEMEPRLANAAKLIVAEDPAARRRLDPRVDSVRVREAVQSLAHGTGFPRDLRDVEGGATLLDLPEIERSLRRMPLREDGTWIDDHARLAQVRARILCATFADGIPLGAPRVGRPRIASPAGGG